MHRAPHAAVLLLIPLATLATATASVHTTALARAQAAGPSFTQGAHPRDASRTLDRYTDDAIDRLRAQAARAGARQRAELEMHVTSALLRNLVARALHPAHGMPPVHADDRQAGIEALTTLTTPLELACALRVLDGEGSRPNFIASDAAVRRALFSALARESTIGQAELVAFAVTGDDPVRQHATDALPDTLSEAALARLSRLLGSDRELHINRAASIASAHASAALIPALIQAQYAPPREKKGDEAWIAIGKQTRYVQNQIPIVGDASTSFQPVLGTIYEGSLLRIMESMVEIYRTEVHISLARVVEQTTGMPAPPLGYDTDRWMTWYRDEFPALAARHADSIRRAQEEERTVTTPGARES
jgi:hypothetical protein